MGLYLMNKDSPLIRCQVFHGIMTIGAYQTLAALLERHTLTFKDFSSFCQTLISFFDILHHGLIEMNLAGFCFFFSLGDFLYHLLLLFLNFLRYFLTTNSRDYITTVIIY